MMTDGICSEVEAIINDIGYGYLNVGEEKCSVGSDFNESGGTSQNILTVF